MAKVSTDHMRKCIDLVLEGSQEKKREFLETIELQIGLKNYDPQKDKRFSGVIQLPHVPRPKMRVCVLGDAYHCEKAAGLGLDFKNAEGLKNFNKNKKLIKKFGAHHPPTRLDAAPLCAGVAPVVAPLAARPPLSGDGLARSQEVSRVHGV
jgi:ribosomal protein L1